MDTLNREDLIEALVNEDVLTFDTVDYIVELSYDGTRFIETSIDEEGYENEVECNED